jgi:hypothetical protein
MSRHLRRQLERDQRRGINRSDRVVALPSLLDEFTVFDMPQRILDQISNDSLDAQGGVPVFKDGSGIWMQVVPAFEGWIFTWRELDQKLNLGIAAEIDALDAINKCLHYAMPITEEKISIARTALKECRLAFRATNRQQIASIAKTSQIKILLESA